MSKIIDFALENKIHLYSPESVKEEIIRVLKRELNYSDELIDTILNELPITWVEKDIYAMAIAQTQVKHKPDKPIEALSLVLNCGILSADHHFRNRINIDELLNELEKQ